MATLECQSPTPYSHRSLGFVVDLGGTSAAADPLGLPMGGWPAAMITHGYHLAAMPGNRFRTVLDWFENALLGAQEVQLQMAVQQPLLLDTDRK